MKARIEIKLAYGDHLQQKKFGEAIVKALLEIERQMVESHPENSMRINHLSEIYHEHQSN